jgi:nucleoside-diphosphate-sugar epimerase
MKIFVAGATGRVGQELVKDLVADGNFVYAGGRKIIDYGNTDQIKPVYLDLHADLNEIADLLEDSEAVYFVAGSRGKDLLQTDLNGAVKVMMAAEKRGIKRFIQLSSLFALEQDRWSESYLKGITDYNIAKFFSDAWLKDNTDLDYTIVQAGNLKEEPLTDQVDLQATEPGENTIPDVAKVLADTLKFDNTIKKVILMHSGDSSIDNALKEI